MLTNLKHLPFFLREVLFNMKRNLLMTLASMSTVMILSLILGFFIVLVMNLNFWSANVVRTLQIVAYLEPNLDESSMKTLQNKIAVIPEVKDVKYISKDDALRKMRVKLGNRLELSDIGSNPLPDSFEINLTNYEKIPAAAELIKKNKGISEVRYGEDITKKLISLNKAVRVVGFIIVVSLISATIFIVSNTIRITVYARRREISIMQLVGASNWFIRWPFVIEGILYGLIGSGFAVLIIALAYSRFIPQINLALPFIVMVKPSVLILRMSYILVFTGAMVGIAGSWISVNKYLKNFVSRSKFDA